MCFFVAKTRRDESVLPTTKFQKIVFAFLTVIITVHCFVFYNLAIEMGGMSNQVFHAWAAIIPIEFIAAILLEIFVASPLAEKIAFRLVNPAQDKPYVVTTAIICATVVLMCPTMSFVATILYNGFTPEFITQWMRKIVINFPFAFFSQLFFIHLFVRFVFGLLFRGRAGMAEVGPRAEGQAAELAE